MLKSEISNNSKLTVNKPKDTERLSVFPEFINKARSDSQNFTFGGSTLITLYPTLMGPISGWKAQLEYLITERGYRAFHFPPVQKLGGSLSLYCIDDYEVPNPDVFGSATDLSALKQIFVELKQKYNVMFMTDIVMNHCADESTWILKERNCYYTSLNTPHLGIAYNLDIALYHLSVNFQQMGITPSRSINNYDEVNMVMQYIKDKIIYHTALFYQLNLDAVLEDLKNFMLEKKRGQITTDDLSAFVELENFDVLLPALKNKGARVRGVQIDLQQLHDCLVRNFGRVTLQDARTVLTYLNSKQSEILRNWEDDIMNNVRQEIEAKYIRGDYRVVDKDHRLVERYFYELSNGDAAACNGYINNYNLDEDFAESDQNFYYRRMVTSYYDVIKLRFTVESDAPLLWKKMSNYFTKSAAVFDAFRMDNFHNAKSQIACQFLAKAFAVNNNLLVMAELFPPTPEAKARYITQGGVHWNMHEAQNCFYP